MRNKLIYLIVAFIFLNLYKRFVFSYSFINGTPNIYLTPKIYATDFFLLLLLLLNIFGVLRKSKSGNLLRIITINFREYRPVLIFALFTGISVLLSKNTNYSIIGYIRLLLYLSLFLMAANWCKTAFDVQKFSTALSVPVLIVSVLALLQWSSQRFVWGFFPLGEPTFSASSVNSPLVNFLGGLRLRSFGSLPHPNVLGGFLSVVLVWILDSFISNFKDKHRDKSSIFLFVVILFGLSSLFLSFSQGAWGVFILAMGIYFVSKLNINRSARGYGLLFLITVTVVVSLMVVYKLPLDPAPDRRRFELIEEAIFLVLKNPLAGVGLGNFVAFSSYYWKEPVHNIYLLLLAETGILGLIPFLLLLSALLKRAYISFTKSPLILISVVQLLTLGLFDHYLLTTQPGNILFWLFLGLAFGKSLGKNMLF